jgi:hypothetical protein
LVAFGTGNDYREWDFTLAYFLELGRVFLTPGYNFWYQPRVIEEDPDESGDKDQEDLEGKSESPAARGNRNSRQLHDASSHELFFVLGTTIVPFVTPSLFLVWDLNNTPGVYMEFRLDGNIRLYREILSIQPYALLGLNFGYNTRAYYGWNNFQFGLTTTWKIDPIVSIFGGINYSVAMTALKRIDQGNEIWASAGVILSY